MWARPTRATAAWVLALSLSVVGFVFAQTETFAELRRKDTRIVVTLKARSADGARFIGNNRNCEPDVNTSLFYGPDPGFVNTAVDADTILKSNVAIIRTPMEAAGDGSAGGGGAESASAVGGDGAPGGGAAVGGAAAAGDAAAAGPSAGGNSTPSDPASTEPTSPDPTSPDPTSSDPTSSDPTEQQTLELYNGSVVIGRPGCIESEERASDATVQLVQGRTTVSGTRFFLDRGADTGTMDGPITLARTAIGDSPGLDATAQAMTLNTQDQHATLSGDVRVVSEDRTTTADTLELDEEAGIAVLTGSPARSVKGNDVLQGERLLYYLDSNDVVVLGKVYGELEFDL